MYENKYYEVGQTIGKAWNIGKYYEPNNPWIL
jgi:hypothetical protein